MDGFSLNLVSKEQILWGVIVGKNVNWNEIEQKKSKKKQSDVRKSLGYFVLGFQNLIIWKVKFSNFSIDFFFDFFCSISFQLIPFSTMNPGNICSLATKLSIGYQNMSVRTLPQFPLNILMISLLSMYISTLTPQTQNKAKVMRKNHELKMLYNYCELKDMIKNCYYVHKMIK